MQYPIKLDLERGRVLRIELARSDFQRASFLDERILTPQSRGSWIALDELAAADSAAPSAGRPALHFIFHTGHVGSTLVSRLLDETERVWPLREPLPLRTLAAAQDLGDPRAPALISLFTRLWRQVDGPDEAVILKATSTAARTAPALLQGVPESRALYLNVGAESYLATLLAGTNSMTDLQGHAAERANRLARHLGSPEAAGDTRSPGEFAAAAWLAETLTQRALLAGFPGRVLPIDFDALLGDLPGHLRAILGHLALPSGPAEIAKLMASPALRSYSKAPEQVYDARLRAAILQESRRVHREEILKGLRWIERRRPR